MQRAHNLFEKKIITFFLKIVQIQISSLHQMPDDQNPQDHPNFIVSSWSEESINQERVKPSG